MITPHLSGPALDALRRATPAEDSITLPPEYLPRWAWQQLNAAATLLAEGGARWEPRRRAWLYAHDPRPALTRFLAFQGQRTADTRMVPAGPLEELADRLDATADTGGCGDAASALRDVLAQLGDASPPAGFVIARWEPVDRLVADWDEIHNDKTRAQELLRLAQDRHHHGYGLYALVEVPDA